MAEFEYDDIDLPTLGQEFDDRLRGMLQFLPDVYHDGVMDLILRWESIDRRTVAITDPIDFSSPHWNEYLSRVHASPSPDDSEFNDMVAERANDGTIESFASAYRLPTGSVLVYKGLAATRRDAEALTGVITIPLGSRQYVTEQIPLIDVTETGTLTVAAIEAEVAKRAGLKPLLTGPDPELQAKAKARRQPGRGRKDG